MIDELSGEDVRRLARVAGQEWDDATVAELLPQIKGVMTAAKRSYDLELGDTESALVFSLEATEL